MTDQAQKVVHWHFLYRRNERERWTMGPGFYESSGAANTASWRLQLPVYIDIVACSRPGCGQLSLPLTAGDAERHACNPAAIAPRHVNGTGVDTRLTRTPCQSHVNGTSGGVTSRR